MNKKSVLFALAGIAVLFFAVVATIACAEETAFIVSPSVPSIAAGESFTISVLIEPDRPIAGAQLNMELKNPEKAKESYQVLCWNHNAMKFFYPEEYNERMTKAKKKQS